ncbi:MAG: right-handed parallel beta-helix repeat-containing protein [Lachnospiraceae bacterium]|nr:right-handed parallel beta-helix repeat-containing protein [Lachnospiraceae bacterium]
MKGMTKRSIIFTVFMLVFSAVIAAALQEEALAKTKYAKTITVKLIDGQDATSAIQSALDEAAKAGTKKKQALVKIPAGTYYLSRTLSIGSNTCLSLDKNTVMKKSTNVKDPIAYMLRSKQGSKGGFSDTSNITVTGGTWDAEYIAFNETSGGSLFFFVHTTDLTISDVHLCHNFGTHLIELGGVKKCTIKNCRLHGFKAAKEDTEKEAIQLDVCHNNNILPYGDPFDDSPCANITITGCEIYDYPRAIGSHMKVKGIYHDKITISKNVLHDVSAAAIYGYNYINVTIKENTMINVGSGVQIKTDATKAKKTILDRLAGVKEMKVKNGEYNIKILKNTITLSKKSYDDDSETEAGVEKDSGGCGVFLFGSEENNMKGVTISNNDMVCNASGVYLRYCDDATIAYNSIDRHIGAIGVETTKGVAEDAVKLRSCDRALIDGNLISTINPDMYENGIAMREGCIGAVISNNTIEGTTKSGIALYDQSSITDGENNTIENAGKHGIIASASEINLSGGTVTGAAEHGISILSGGKISLKNVTISNSAKRGINIKDNGVLEAENVKSLNSGEKGIDIAENCKATLINCEIGDGLAYGVDADKNSVITMTGCIVNNNKDNGVNIRSYVTITIDNCTIIDNDAKGVDIGAYSKVKLLNCHITGCKGRAVDIAANTTVDMSDCIITNNKGDAVNADGADSYVTIDKCHILENGGEALHLKKGTVSISENEIRNNCLNEIDGNAVKIFGDVSGSFVGNTLSDPYSKYEIKVDSTKLSPSIPSAKTGKVTGTTDIGGNIFE